MLRYQDGCRARDASPQTLRSQNLHPRKARFLLWRNVGISVLGVAEPSDVNFRVVRQPPMVAFNRNLIGGLPTN